MRTIAICLALALLWRPMALADQPASPAAKKAPPKKKNAPPKKAVASARESQKTVLLTIRNDPKLPRLAAEIVAASKGSRRAIEISGLPIEDIQLAIGCADRSADCLRRIGNTVAAPLLLLVSSKTAGGKNRTQLRLFDVKAARDLRSKTQRLPHDAKARALALQKMLEQLYATEAPKVAKTAPQLTEQIGSLYLACAIPAVALTINGQPRGGLPLDLDGLPPGSYTLKASRPGYFPWQKTVTVKADQTTRVVVSLRARPVMVAKNLLDAIRLPTWITAGATLLTFSLGVGFGAHMSAQQTGFDNLSASNVANVRAMQAFKKTGDRDATVANVFFALTGAGVAATAALVYFDLRRNKAAERATFKTPKLVIGPANVQLNLRF